MYDPIVKGAHLHHSPVRPRGGVVAFVSFERVARLLRDAGELRQDEEVEVVIDAGLQGFNLYISKKN